MAPTTSLMTFTPADLDIARALGMEPGDTGGPLSRHSAAPVSTAELWRDVRRVADALGVPERGVQVVTRWRHRLRAIAERAAARPRRRVAVLLGGSGGEAAEVWRAELLSLAGADDAMAGRCGEGVRALAAADPDAILIAPAGAGFDTARALLEDLASRRGWKSLRAVRGGQVLLADGRAGFSRPGTHVIRTLEVLAEALHPEAFRFGHHGLLWRRWAA